MSDFEYSFVPVEVGSFTAFYRYHISGPFIGESGIYLELNKNLPEELTQTYQGILIFEPNVINDSFSYMYSFYKKDVSGVNVVQDESENNFSEMNEIIDYLGLILSRESSALNISTFGKNIFVGLIFNQQESIEEPISEYLIGVRKYEGVGALFKIFPFKVFLNEEVSVSNDNNTDKNTETSDTIKDDNISSNRKTKKKKSVD